MDFNDEYEKEQTEKWCEKLYHDIEFNRNIELANNGDKNAAYYLFKSYSSKKYYPKNNEKADFYLNKSAEAGHKEAQFFMGMYNFLGWFESGKNDKLAFEWLLKSAKNNNKTSMYVVYKFYADGICTPVNLYEYNYWKKSYQEYKDENFRHYEYENNHDTYIGVPFYKKTDSVRWLLHFYNYIFNKSDDLQVSNQLN